MTSFLGILILFFFFLFNSLCFFSGIGVSIWKVSFYEMGRATYTANNRLVFSTHVLVFKTRDFFLGEKWRIKEEEERNSFRLRHQHALNHEAFGCWWEIRSHLPIHHNVNSFSPSLFSFFLVSCTLILWTTTTHPTVLLLCLIGGKARFLIFLLFIQIPIR